MNSNHIDIWVHGSASPNPGVAAWAAVLVVRTRPNHDVTKVVTGTSSFATSHAMQLIGMADALKRLKRRCYVCLHTTSQAACASASRCATPCLLDAFEGGRNIYLERLLNIECQKHAVTTKWHPSSNKRALLTKPQQDTAKYIKLAEQSARAARDGHQEIKPKTGRAL